jgi:hypothetical protein
MSQNKPALTEQKASTWERQRFLNNAYHHVAHD